MSAPSSQSPGRAPAAVAPSASELALENDLLDRSTSGPFLFLFTASLAWLMLGSLLWLLASLKLHHPDFLADCSFLTYGKVRPAASFVFVYGFGIQAGLAMATWLMVRLSRQELLYPGLCHLAAFLWNTAVLVGLGFIFAGQGSGHEGLEMPLEMLPALFVVFGVMAVWGLITFHYRVDKTIYPAMWYVLAACFWFPWMLTTAFVFLQHYPVRGVLQSGVAWWFLHNLQNLWFTPITLGILYYFIPKLSQRPLYSLYLALFGFWCYAFFAGWGGGTAGAPLPAWINSLSIVGQVFVFLSAVAAVINLYLTFRGSTAEPRPAVTMQFFIFSLWAYFLFEASRMILSWRTIGAWTNFTFVVEGVNQFGFYAGFVGAIFGAAYYIVPRVTRTEWIKTSWLRTHFLLAVAGIVLFLGASVAAGIIQGIGMNKPSLQPLELAGAFKPVLYLRTLAILILTVGNLLLFLNLLKILRANCSWCNSRRETLMATAQPAAGGAR